MRTLFPKRNNVRKNRHDYFELAYLCRGAASLEIQDRSLPLKEGDLAVVGSTLYHRFECSSNPPLTLAVLFFQPDLVRADGGPDNAEYLTPFLLQDPHFPHVVGAGTAIPGQVFDLMQRIRGELPAGTPRARLAVKTYLKMILILLVNQYASYAGTVDTFRRQQRALERLRPLFEHLEKHFDEPTQVQEAAHICGMSESHFMSFFNGPPGVIHGVPESLPHRAGAGASGYDGQVGVGYQPGDGILRPELFRHGIPETGGHDPGGLSRQVTRGWGHAPG